MRSTQESSSHPDIGQKVRFLKSPEAYAGVAGPVSVEETHMSWVFLVGERVYKLKKPVRRPFLDFSTLSAREVDCREEVRLNRRLAPDVYLGLVRLTRDASGRLTLGGAGETVDWLVEMRRLPAERMLDQAIASGAVTGNEIMAVARRLAEFYRTAAPANISGADYVDQFAEQQAHNREVLTEHGFDLDGAEVEAALGAVESTLRERAKLLHGRVAAGRIVDGHGDLRPEHICLVVPPAIIDCLEFSRRLRLTDPVDELSFLTVECERLGARWIGDLVLDHYAESAKDRPDEELVAFYWSYRACLRARLSLVHLVEKDHRTPEKWLPLARRYIEIAASPPLTPRRRAVR